MSRNATNPFTGETIYYVCNEGQAYNYSGLKRAASAAMACKARNERVWVEDADGFIVPESEQVKAILG